MNLGSRARSNENGAKMGTQVSLSSRPPLLKMDDSVGLTSDERVDLVLREILAQHLLGKLMLPSSRQERASRSSLDILALFAPPVQSQSRKSTGQLRWSISRHVDELGD